MLRALEWTFADYAGGRVTCGLCYLHGMPDDPDAGRRIDTAYGRGIRGTVAAPRGNIRRFHVERWCSTGASPSVAPVVG